jgi:hypothetical protein
VWKEKMQGETGLVSDTPERLMYLFSPLIRTIYWRGREERGG